MDIQPVTQPTCANCDAPLNPEFRYCPQCSQKVNLHRLNLHDIFHDAVHYFTHADKGIIGLIKDLAVKTGKVANEYVSGKRKKHFPPLNFFLLAGTIYVLVVNAANPPREYDASKDALKAYPQLTTYPKHVQQYVINLYDRQHKALTFMTKYSNTVAMIGVPFTCLLYWLFYIRGRFNYTEHMVAGMYMGGFTNIVYALIFVPMGALFGIKQTDPSTMSMVFVVALLLVQITYASVFYYRFINKGTAASAWKAAGVSLLVTVVWIALTGVVVFLYILHGFWGLLK